MAENAGSRRIAGWRVALAAVLFALVSAYTYGVIVGAIPEKQRIDATHLVVIVVVVSSCALLLLPDIFGRIKTFELQGFKLELERVRERQRKQELELEDVRLLIPLLLPDPERNHLMNLARGTSDVVGSDRRRTELRKLTSLGLMRRKTGRHIADLKDGETLDLAEILEITPLGEQWVRRLQELEAQKHDSARDAAS